MLVFLQVPGQPLRAARTSEAALQSASVTVMGIGLRIEFATGEK
jgi:hypothetical protein